MSFFKIKRKTAGLAIGMSLSLLNASYAGIAVDYASPMGAENWRMSGNPLRCGLALTIPDYGIAYFEQYATKPTHFILRKWQEVQRRLPASVYAASPVWKPKGSRFLVSRSHIQPGKYGIYLDRDPSLKLLTYLSRGYLTEINYKSEQGFDVAVRLSPIHFQTVYSKFQRCLSGLLDYTFDDVRRTVFRFGVEDTELSEDAREQLKRIATYVKADHQVQVIRIMGYTDDLGRRGYNNAISQYRAEAVYKYLLKLGVSKNRMNVTWFGMLKPIARNDTEEGRAANRRVIVVLRKK